MRAGKTRQSRWSVWDGSRQVKQPSGLGEIWARREIIRGNFLGTLIHISLQSVSPQSSLGRGSPVRPDVMSRTSAENGVQQCIERTAGRIKEKGQGGESLEKGVMYTCTHNSVDFHRKCWKIRPEQLVTPRSRSVRVHVMALHKHQTGT